MATTKKTTTVPGTGDGGAEVNVKVNSKGTAAYGEPGKGITQMQAASSNKPQPVNLGKASADKMKKETPNQASFNKAYEKRTTESKKYVNKTLDNSLDKNKESVNTAYERNKEAQDKANKKGQKAYKEGTRLTKEQANITENEQNDYADARGLNRYSGSQQALSLNRGRQTALGRIAARQQEALADNAARQQQLATSAQNQIKQAIADNDYRRAAALYDDWNNQNNWLEKNAAILASYGNFTGYAKLYGGAQAKNMRQVWIGSNPDLAYNTGAIDKKQYKKITGIDPPDYVAPSGGGGGNLGEGWWRGKGDSTHYKDDSKPDPGSGNNGVV